MLENENHSQFHPQDTEHTNPKINFAKYPLPTRKKRSKIWLLLIVIILVIFGVGCVSYIKSQTTVSTNPNDYDPVTLKPKAPQGLLRKIGFLVFNNEQALKGQNEDRINILLLGIGGPGHDGPYLTDTMILASIKPSTGQIAMVSIPRDLGVNIPDYGFYKINHANAFGELKQENGGPELAAQVVEKTFNIPIHYYVRADFKAFEEIIDEVGGVKINVERNFTDTEYPDENYGYQTVSFNKGAQLMNGKTALIYARSRHGNNFEGSDFARSVRQQKMLLALKEKLTSFSTLANPIKIGSIIDSLSKHIVTNISFAEMMEFANMSRNLNTANINTVVVDDSPDGFLKQDYTQSGAYVLEPATGNFDDINNAIANIYNSQKHLSSNTPKQDNPPPSGAAIEIQNGTWRAGLAARLKMNLQEKNFKIKTVGNTKTRPISDSAIYVVSSTSGNTTAIGLQQELHIPIKQFNTTTINFATSTDILVIIGDDFEN